MSNKIIIEDQEADQSETRTKLTTNEKLRPNRGTIRNKDLVDNQ